MVATVTFYIILIGGIGVVAWAVFQIPGLFLALSGIDGRLNEAALTILHLALLLGLSLVLLRIVPLSLVSLIMLLMCPFITLSHWRKRRRSN